MSDDEFIALGEEKIDEFLKSVGAPENFKAKNVIDAVKKGMMTTKRMAEMLKQMPKPKSKEGADPKEKSLLAFSDKELEGKGFIDWKSFKHPTLGEVEIGGAVPFTDNTPPVVKIEGLLEGQVPWIFEIAGKLPRIKISKTKVEPLGKGIYRLKIWVENIGYLPYPTAMGKRNSRIFPVKVSLGKGEYQILEGKKRSFINAIEGLKAQTVSWIIMSDKPIKLTVNAGTNIAWNDSISVSIGDK